jgi:ectoine hydroxylase-related dioxygenase (phytanoyl-CoA dioxygenase family)
MDDASPLLTEDEKWTFDLHGYLVLRGVIDAERLDAMLAVIRGWLSAPESDVPKPLLRHRQEPHKTHIDHIQYGDPLFADLAMDPEIMRVVCGLMFSAPRLFHCNFTMMDQGDEEKWGFHRDDSGYKFPPGFRNPHNDYQANGHDIYCSHVCTWVALADVPDETGFCLVPGSHKSNFRVPADLPVKHAPPTSVTVPLNAGDVIVFATSLLHDATAWTEERPRLNIFQRYQLSVYFNEAGKGGYPLEEHRSLISDGQYELESLGRQTKAAARRARRDPPKP